MFCSLIVLFWWRNTKVPGWQKITFYYKFWLWKSWRCVLESSLVLCYRRVFQLVSPVFVSDECTSNPCVNGGTCVDRVNGFNCSCGEGYSGDFCQIRLWEAVCSPKVCEGGMCVDEYSANRALCICGGGYRLSKSTQLSPLLTMRTSLSHAFICILTL